MSDEYNSEEVGRRLKEFRQRKHLTQGELGAKLDISQRLIAFWEKGEREIPLAQLDRLCQLLGISYYDLLRGLDERNQTVNDELGLSDNAINYLKDINQRRGDYQESFIETAETMVNNPKQPITKDQPVTDGGTTEEILFILNWMLSKELGHNLLSLIAKYCLLDTSQGWIFSSSCSYDTDEPFDPMEECDEIYFRNRVGEGWTAVNPGILRYALIQAVTANINKMRKEIIKGGK